MSTFNSGVKRVLTLRKYVNGVATNQTKNNVSTDADYIADYTSELDCPANQSPTTQALSVFSCTQAGFTMADANNGDSTAGNGTVSLGTITNISPSTYSAGSATYTATITVPSGYSNAGQSITCTDIAEGTVSATSPGGTTLPQNFTKATLYLQNPGSGYGTLITTGGTYNISGKRQIYVPANTGPFTVSISAQWSVGQGSVSTRAMLRKSDGSAAITLGLPGDPHDVMSSSNSPLNTTTLTGQSLSTGFWEMIIYDHVLSTGTFGSVTMSVTEE